MTSKWSAVKSCQMLMSGASEAHAQTSASPVTKKDWGGEQSRMFFEVIRLLEERTEHSQALPTYLLMENVKNLLSSNGGWDFARVQIEMDKIGYDVEWNVFDSAEVVPQHRERVYIVGHLRGQSTRKVFPIVRQSSTASEKFSVKRIGYYGIKEHQGSRGISDKGTAQTLSATDYKHPQNVCQSVKSQIKVIGNTSKTSYRSHDVVADTGIAKTLTASEGVKIHSYIAVHQIGNISKSKSFGNNPQTGRVYDTNGLSPTLNTMQGGGREPKVMLNKPYGIRKLTPLECWRLQGFDDKQFYKAKNAGLSNAQLYKQAGNAVTVPVVEAIAEKMSQDGQGVVILPNKIKENE